MKQPDFYAATLSTGRLILKGISPQEIRQVFENLTEAEIKEFLGADDKLFQYYKEKHEKGMETHRLSAFIFLLENKATNTVIGECGFHTWNRTHRRAEVFYSMRDDAFKKQGFMTEALAAVLAYGFDNLGLHRIQALVYKENIPSLKLLNRYGFSFEGTMREDYCVDGRNEDSECYSLLKQEWEGIRG